MVHQLALLEHVLALFIRKVSIRHGNLSPGHVLVIISVSLWDPTGQIPLRNSKRDYRSNKRVLGLLDTCSHLLTKYRDALVHIYVLIGSLGLGRL